MPHIWKQLTIQVYLIIILELGETINFKE